MARLAARQHGVVAATQLRRIGFTSRAIEVRLASGRLHRVHRGVYAVGHRTLTVSGLRLAAVLRGGTGTVLSHRAGGDEWGLRRWSGGPAITTPTPRHPIAGIETHFSRLPADERTVLDGIPITTWPRTLLDLATVLDHDALIRALDEADARELTDPLPLVALLERHRGERGAGALRRALGDASRGRGVTSEELEERFAAFIRRSELPLPLLNAPLRLRDRSYVADALWPEARLIVELQSVRFHGTAAAMSADADRTRRLTLAGYRVVYVTWAQLARRAAREALAHDLRAMLGAAAA
jgi:hypothetical protein